MSVAHTVHLVLDSCILNMLFRPAHIPSQIPVVFASHMPLTQKGIYTCMRVMHSMSIWWYPQMWDSRIVVLLVEQFSALSCTDC